MGPPLRASDGDFPPAPDPTYGHPAWQLFSRLIGWTAPAIVVTWIGLTVASIVLVPSLAPTSTRSEFAGLVASKAPALQTQKAAVRRFGYPLIAQNVVVQHRRGGLSVAAQARTVATAVRLDTKGLPGLKGIAAAVPVTNELKLAPGSKHAGTTALTYLFFKPSANVDTTKKLSQQYARRYLSAPGDGLVGVTGAYPAEAAQTKQMSGALNIVEYVSIAVLLLVVGVAFRSVVAPLLTLFTAGMTYELSRRLLSLAKMHLGISVPSELDPVIVVLLFGVVTDYSVFYLSALRRRLKDSDTTRGAVRRTIVEATPLVLVASATVAMGVALSTAARLPLFAALGPGLAISVGVVVATATTFTPAALYLLRSVALWPSAGRTSKASNARRRLQYALAKRWVGVPVLLVGLSGLVFLAVNVSGIKLSTNLISDLPGSNTVVKASQSAGRGFAPGAVEPSELLVESRSSSGDQSQFSHLQADLSRVPGVRAVIGPADIPPSLGVRNVFVSADRRAARYLVVLADRPLGAAGIHDLHRVEAAVPGLLARTGLNGFTPAYAGDTALSLHIARSARSDLLYVGLYVAGIDLIMAIVLLRSIIGPLVLTLASMLVVASTVGLTSLVFPGTRVGYGFTFYVPFAAAILLLSFGADYNLFLAGEIWENSRTRRFRVAVPEGATRAGGAINAAGLTLALTFSALALVPLTSFRHLAFLMSVGLLLDTFVVRFLIVPIALDLVGPVAKWPAARRRRREETGVGEGAG